MRTDAQCRAKALKIWESGKIPKIKLSRVEAETIVAERHEKAIRTAVFDLVRAVYPWSCQTCNHFKSESECRDDYCEERWRLYRDIYALCQPYEVVPVQK